MVIEELLFKHCTDTRGIAIPMAVDTNILLVNYHRLTQVFAALSAPDVSVKVFFLPIVEGDGQQSLVKLHFLTDVLFADFNDNNASCTHILIV
jgi:hypothetical protein